MKYSDYLYFWVKTGQEITAANEIKMIFNNEVTSLQLLIETFFRKQGKVKKETHLAFPGYVFIATDINNNAFIKRFKECFYRTNSILRLLCYGDTSEAAMRTKERAAIDCLW